MEEQQIIVTQQASAQVAAEVNHEMIEPVQPRVVEESKVEGSKEEEPPINTNSGAALDAAEQDAEQKDAAQPAKLRKNRELSYMQTSNIIENGGNAARGIAQANGISSLANSIPIHQRIKNSMKSFMQRARQERSLDFRNVRRQSLDQLRIPQEVEYLFPNKVRIYDQMRELEENMNSYMRQKLLSAKEDLLQSNLRAKRNLRLLVEVNPQSKLGLNSTEWKIRIEGRLISESEEEMLKSDNLDSKRFLNYFERINVTFDTGNEEYYPAVDWIKAKSELGGAFDCFELTRAITKEQRRKLGESSKIKVKLQFYLENNPRKYRLSQSLTRILGGMEEATRIQIVGALWQYVKSNRLQDADNRELINCNNDLSEIFGCGVGEEKLEFHQAVFRLKDHLYDLPPIELALEVIFGDKQQNFIVYELPVFEYGGGNHREQIEFLINCDYDFFTDKNDLQNDQDLYLEDSIPEKKSTTKLSQLNGAILKRREKKYNLKVSESIDSMKRSYRHLHFYQKLAANPKTQIQNVIIEQNKWLRIMQEERPLFQAEDKEEEVSQAAFYQQNQSWLMGEVENYLKKAQSEKKNRQQINQQNESDEAQSEEGEGQEEQNEE